MYTLHLAVLNMETENSDGHLEQCQLGTRLGKLVGNSNVEEIDYSVVFFTKENLVVYL